MRKLRFASIIERTAGFFNAALVINPIVFLATTLALELVQPGYDRVRDTVSALVWGEHGWVLTASFVLLGITLIVSALRLNSIAPRGRCALVGKALLALMGIGFFVIAVFPTTAPFTSPTAISAVHQYTARAISFLFPIMCLFVARAMTNEGQWRVLRRGTIALGILAATLLPAGALATFTDAPWLGGVERLILAWGLLWMEAVGIGLVIATVRSRGDNPSVEKISRVPALTNADVYSTGERVYVATYHNRDSR